MATDRLTQEASVKHRELIRRRPQKIRGWRPCLSTDGMAWVKGHRW